MDLEEIRQGIDQLDQTIFDAFTERMELCKQVAAYKIAHGMPVFQTAREDAVIEKARGRVPAELSDGAALLSRTVMDISKHLQYKQMLNEKPVRSHASFTAYRNSDGVRVGCAGTEGANAETAVKKLFGETCSPAFYATFEEVFCAVENGEIDFGVIPVQNSTAGTVVQAYDLMGRHAFWINATTVVEITNCLAAKPGTKLEEIQEVFSHQQALMQCSEFISKHGFHPNNYSNTATAAKMVSESDQPYGAICSENCAAVHGLEILADHISDYVPNYTRFICISKELTLSEDSDTISVILKIPHEEGALHRLLSKFVICGLNLQKIESRPIRDGSFEVMFYLDFNGNIRNESVKALIDDFAENLEYFKFLGNYCEI